MKKYYALGLLFCICNVFAQHGNQIGSLAEAEMKSASGLMNMAVNANTSNYDVTYQKLEFTVNPNNYFISGKVTTTYKALSNMSTVTFDLTNELNVTSVKKNGSPLVFVQNANNELVITLPAVQTTGTSATVEIIYSGEPASGEEAFTQDTHNGAPIIYTLSEPYGARDWWPCKQDLNDKVDSIDVYITAPSQYVAVANGLQMGQTTSGGNKTTHFHHGYPIPAYLIAIAVTNYSIFTQTAGTAPNEFPIVNYIYPEDFTEAQEQVAVTLPIMDLYESLFETYPFANEKYGHAQFNYGGGMEHTTVSFMAGFNRELIAHELGHQWFGDKVTCGSWQDIWLNEGFATYLSGLVIEHLDGIPDFVNWKAEQNDYITSSPGGAVYLTEDETDNVNRIFSGRLSYSKGAMVVEMLRWKLGDTNFYQGVKNYLADPALAYKYALTNNLKTHLEAVSGLSLTEFFNDWVYNQGYPSYTITARNIAPGQARITINQTQSHPSVSFFEMPVPVRIFGAGGQQQDLVLNNTSNGQIFNVSVPFTVTGVEFDPEIHIISRDNSITLGAENFDLTEGISLFPNPAADMLNLSLPQNVGIQKTVFHNLLGQIVLETTSQTSWDISKLATGVHFITVTTDAGKKQLKFIKK